MKIVSFDSLTSTNTHALELALHGAEAETVIWARQQTSGKGQYDRQFSSPVGGLYFSLILQPALSWQNISLVTLAAGVGCCLCLEDTFKLTPLLKWPNDIYVEGNKLGGILTQTLPFRQGEQATVVIGVGLNVNSRPVDFPLELQPSITTLAELISAPYDLRLLLEALVTSVVSQVHLLKRDKDKLLAQWDQRDYLKGQSLVWDNGRTMISGTGQGISEDGCYGMLDGAGNVHAILAGTLRPALH